MILDLHWFEFGVFVLGEAITVIAPRWLTPWLAGSPVRTVVRQQRLCAYVAVVALLQAVLYFIIGLYGQVLQQGWDQILPWSELILGFAAGGSVLLLWYRAESIAFSPSGLIVRRWMRQARNISWRDVLRITLQRDRLTLELSDGKRIGLSAAAENLAYLVEAAKTHNIILFGFGGQN